LGSNAIDAAIPQPTALGPFGLAWDDQDTEFADVEAYASKAAATTRILAAAASHDTKQA
jgi:hypothetical protein